MDVPFRDREEAGVLLAGRLGYLEHQDMVVLALPRGGVPVARGVADGIGADIDVLVVRKLGAPGQRELALGAVGADGTLVVNDMIVRHAGVSTEALRSRADDVAAQLGSWADTLRGGRPAQPMAGRVVVVVDDGIATGATMRAALQIVRKAGPKQLVAAVPVAPPDACNALAEYADRVECLRQPPAFGSVGEWYRDFHQIDDQDVRRMLAASPAPHPTGPTWR